MADLGAKAYDVTVTLETVVFARVVPDPGALTKTVAGVIYDDTGTPCARVVRAIRRSDGMLVDEVVSDPSTGEYELACTADEVQRIVLDDDGGDLYNDLIDRVIPGP